MKKSASARYQLQPELAGVRTTEYYASGMIDHIIKNLHDPLRLWSGVMPEDRVLKRGESGDSNALIEQLYATIISQIFKREKNMRPARAACRSLQNLIW